MTLTLNEYVPIMNRNYEMFVIRRRRRRRSSNSRRTKRMVLINANILQKLTLYNLIP